jgi:hypothetical protein
MHNRRSSSTFIVAPIAAAACVATVMFAFSARGQDEEKHEEKSFPGQLFTELFVGEKIYSLERGEWYGIGAASFGKAPHEKEFELSGEVIYGLTDQIQLSGEIPLLYVDTDEGSHTGIGDISLAVNWNFWQQPNMAFGVRSEFVFPTGDENRDLGGGQFAWAPSLLSGFRFGQAEVYASIGGEFGDGGDSFFTYSIAGAYPWKQFVGLAELTGESGSGVDVLYFSPGVYWLPNDKLQLGLGIPIGVTSDSDDYRVVFKVAYEF